MAFCVVQMYNGLKKDKTEVQRAYQEAVALFQMRNAGGMDAE